MLFDNSFIGVFSWQVGRKKTKGGVKIEVKRTLPSERRACRVPRAGNGCPAPEHLPVRERASGVCAQTARHSGRVFEAGDHVLFERSLLPVEQ